MKAVAIALRTDFEQPLSGLDQAVRSDESVHDEPRELFVLFLKLQVLVFLEGYSLHVYTPLNNKLFTNTPLTVHLSRYSDQVP